MAIQGSGSQDDPFQITTVIELMEKVQIEGAYLKIMNNMDLDASVGWTNVIWRCAEVDGTTAHGGCSVIRNIAVGAKSFIIVGINMHILIKNINFENIQCSLTDRAQSFIYNENFNYGGSLQLENCGFHITYTGPVGLPFTLIGYKKDGDNRLQVVATNCEFCIIDNTNSISQNTCVLCSRVIGSSGGHNCLFQGCRFAFYLKESSNTILRLTYGGTHNLPYFHKCYFIGYTKSDKSYFTLFNDNAAGYAHCYVAIDTRKNDNSSIWNITIAPSTSLDNKSYAKQIIIDTSLLNQKAIDSIPVAWETTNDIYGRPTNILQNPDELYKLHWYATKE